MISKNLNQMNKFIDSDNSNSEESKSKLSNNSFFDNNVHELPKLKLDTTTVLASKRNSGKTVTVINLIYNFLNDYDFDYYIMMSNTAEFLEEYDWMDKQFIYKWDDNVDTRINKLIEYQKQKRILHVTKGKPRVNCLMILDDITIGKKSKSLERLFTEGRHYYITLILSLQYPKYVCSKMIRNNIDYLFISELNDETLDALVKDCITISGIKKKDITQFITKNNGNYQFILFNNKEQDKHKRLMIIKSKIIKLRLLNNKKQFKTKY